MTRTTLAVYFLCISVGYSQNLDSLEQVYQVSTGEQRARLLNELTLAYQRIDHKKIETFANEAKRLISETDNETIRGYAYLTQAIHNGIRGVPDSAVHYFKEAIRIGKAIDNSDIHGKALTGAGRSSITAGKPAEGLEYLFEALELLKKYPDKKDTEWRVRTNIAWAYLELKQYRDCIRFGEETRRELEERKLDWISIVNNNNVAVAYGAIGQLDSAKKIIERSIAIGIVRQDNVTVANAYFILGNIYVESKRYNEALEQYLKAKPYREKVGDPVFLVSDLYTMSELYYKMGRFQEGAATANEALKLAEKYNLLLKFEGTYAALAKNYEALKDYKNASKYYKLWALTKDSVYSKSHTEAIAEMRTKYETEKKEQQLALQSAQLNAQQAQLERTYFAITALIVIVSLIIVILVLMRNRYRRKQQLAERQREVEVREAYINATIQSQENERKRVARDLHDGMGQLISALRMTVNNLVPGTDPEERLAIVEKSEKILNDMHREVRAVAFNLMPQTLIQHGLVPALQEMSLRINETSTMRLLVTSFEMPKRLSELQEISVYRIVQEWTTNIVKYAMADKIEVNLVADEKEITVTMEDNGKGFDSNLLEHSKGHGWKNMKSRIGLIKGTIELDTQAGRQGTTLILSFPLTKLKTTVL